jgi:hypothetical protein
VFVWIESERAVSALSAEHVLSSDASPFETDSGRLWLIAQWQVDELYPSPEGKDRLVLVKAASEAVDGARVQYDGDHEGGAISISAADDSRMREALAQTWREISRQHEAPPRPCNAQVTHLQITPPRARSSCAGGRPGFGGAKRLHGPPDGGDPDPDSDSEHARLAAGRFRLPAGVVG